MENKRLKIKLLCPEKLYYDILLKEWHSRVMDKNKCYHIKSAWKNLHNYPLPIQGYNGLVKIKG